jgi:lysozyme
MARKLNQAGLKLIKEFEGCELKAYLDSVGVWTIGYGHTKGVKRGMTITKAEADRIFEEDINIFARGVDDVIDNEISDNEFAACVALAFNIGLSAFSRSSVLRAINRGDFQSAADHFLDWNKGKVKGKLQVIRGLTRRRQAERKLFLTPDESLLYASLSDPVEPTTDNIQDAVAGASPTSTGSVMEAPPTQTIEPTGSGTQVNVQPTVAPVVSSAFDEPVKIAKGKSTDLLNYLMSASGIGSIVAFYQQNPMLTIFFACVVVVAVLTVVIVVHLRKMKEAETKSDPTKYSIQFSNEVKAP